MVHSSSAMDGQPNSLRPLRAFLVGVLGMLLPLACGACELAIRGGNDLQTAGSRITKAAVWAQDQLSGSTASPPATGRSTVEAAPTSTAPRGPDQYLPSEECNWENIKPNC